MLHARSLSLTLSFVVCTVVACVGDNPVSTPDGGGPDGGCARTCSGVCSPDTNDPATGCGAASCQACPTFPNQAAACAAGTCGAGACASGHLDCDPKAPGCETAVDVNNCGKCGGKCGGTNASAVSCGSAPASDAGASTTPACQFTCNGSYAHCSGDDSMGCETNIANDQNNCGTCGHSCLGGLCVAGKCQASIVASKASNDWGNVYEIALNGTSVYGINWYGKPPGTPSAGSVFSVPSNATNGAATWLVKDATSGAYGGIAARFLATNGNKLVYSVYRPTDQAAGLWTVNFDGTANTNVVAGGTGNPVPCGATLAGTYVAGLAFDPTYMYWVHDRDAGSPCPGIFRADPNGANAALHLPNTYLRSPVSDGSGTIYMVSYTNDYNAGFPGIAVLATTGAAIDGAPVVVAQAGSPNVVRFDAQYVYWTDTSNSHFYRNTKVPSTIEDVTPKTGMPVVGTGTFLVDTKNIYFFAGTPTQSLYVMPKDGSKPPVIVFTFPNSGDFALGTFQDDKALYFTNYPTTAIFRLAK